VWQPSFLSIKGMPMSVREPDGIVWRKSTFSAANGACVEVGWRKSSFSAGNGDCVEVAHLANGVAVRDSKQNSGPTLAFPTTAWRRSLSALQAPAP
jgi:hypothetical protein